MENQTEKRGDNVKEKSTKVSQWLKNLLLAWLGFFLLATIAAKAADSFTVAKVTVDTISAKRIEHMVEAEGMMEQNLEQAVMTEGDLLVQTVYVKKGDKVEQGQVLAQLDMEYLEEKIQELQAELTTLKRQTAQSVQNKALEAQNAKKTRERAKEDYDRTIQDNESALKNAKDQWLSAQQALKTAREQQEGGSSKEMSESTSSIEALEQQEQQAAQNYADVLSAYQQAETQAKRQMEDANDMADTTPVEDNSTAEKKYEKSLEKLKLLKEAQGKITSPVQGVITECYLLVGQKTTDTAAFSMSDISQGLRFAAVIQEEDKEFIQVGDMVSIKTYNTTVEKAGVIAIEKEEDNDNLKVIVSVPADNISIGDTATMKISKQSELYSCTIPMEALHKNGEKSFVYVAQEENTVLGQQWVVRELPVEVVEQNSRFAALKFDSLSPDAKIITETDRPVSAGSRIRLQNP